LFYRVCGFSVIMTSIYSKLESERKQKADAIWLDFGEMWLSEDSESRAFVSDFLSKELLMSEDVCCKLLDELNLVHIGEAHKHRVQKKTFVKSHINLSDALGDTLDEGVADTSEVRASLLENLLKVKYARERRILYDENVDLSHLDSTSIKITHPRLYFSAVDDVESLMSGIDPVDRMLVINKVSSGVVKEVVDILKAEGSQSVTSIIRLMGKRYNTWNQKVKTTLEWLQHQGLVYRVGAKRYAFKSEVNEESIPELTALDQQILLLLNGVREGMTFTKICRSLGFINYPLLRAQVTDSIENLENRGYIIRGAYNRIIRKTH